MFGAEPAVNRQLLLENALDLPTVERLVLLLLQATAAERSTLDIALHREKKISLQYFYFFVLLHLFIETVYNNLIRDVILYK